MSGPHAAPAGSARPRLTFFFPAYNEQENVEGTVARALADIGPLVDGSLEVLIVDDGSTDRTPELADALAGDDPRVRVHHQHNRGYGGALRAGFDNARHDVVLTMDADLQDLPEEIPKLVERLERGADLVSAWRVSRNDPLGKRFPSKVFSV